MVLVPAGWDASYREELHESAAVTRPEHARSYPLRHSIPTQAGRRTPSTISIGTFTMLACFAPVALLFRALDNQAPANKGNERGGKLEPRATLSDSLSQGTLSVPASYVSLSCSCLYQRLQKGSVER